MFINWLVLTLGIDLGSGEPEWVVSKERRKWDEIFLSLGPSKGKITGSVAKKEMIKSRLPNPVLAKVWRLADVDGDGALDSDEFALAMHLINVKLDGFDLPEDLPGHLIPPSKKRVLANGRNGSGSGSDGDSYWRGALGSGQQGESGDKLALDSTNVEEPVEKNNKSGKKKSEKSVASDLELNVRKQNKKASKASKTRVDEINFDKPDTSQNNGGGKSSNENNCPTLKIDEKEDLRKKLEEKSKKYQHLPVYDKEEEKRKNKKLEKKMTKIFSDVDKQLGTVTDLTSTHMENKGIKLVPTPFDESEQCAFESTSAQADVHTIKYKSGGVLDNKRSAEKNQGDSDPTNENMNISETSGTPTHDKLLPPYQRKPSQDKTDENYESLGQTFRDLTDKMETVTRDLQGHDSEIPFVDEGSDEDYRENVRVANGRNAYFWFQYLNFIFFFFSFFLFSHL